ncbi:hypothetical protein [Bacillus daqingensis]|uniref:hypothetical protein n=1 Tax=Bacillus daqingensis TaxID=872396 RepID=UPI003F86363C
MKMRKCHRYFPFPVLTDGLVAFIIHEHTFFHPGVSFFFYSARLETDLQAAGCTCLKAATFITRWGSHRKGSDRYLFSLLQAITVSDRLHPDKKQTPG